MRSSTQTSGRSGNKERFSEKGKLEIVLKTEDANFARCVQKPRAGGKHVSFRDKCLI